MKNYTITGSMSRKELANKYGISGKAFNKRLKRHGIDFDNDRILLPSQIEKIIEVLGYWELTITP